MSIRELLDPTNSALIFIDHQPQMSFGVAGNAVNLLITILICSHSILVTSG